MNPIVFPNYENSILNVSNSILKHYGAKTWHPSIQVLDKVLAKNYRNVILLLVDGLGVDAINKHLSENSSLRKYLQTTITSVFPSTTVAATTSVLSGKAPIQTGWFGWHQYIKEEDESVILFLNKAYYNPNKTFEYNIASKYVPYTNLYQQIESANSLVKTDEIFPAFRTPENNTISKLLVAAKEATKTSGLHFVYAYWDKVDTYMHEFGPSSKEVRDHILEVEAAFTDFVNNLEDDTVVIAIADHGQVDVEIIDLYQYTDVVDTLLRMPSNESRATVFYVKPDRLDDFEKLFNQYFKNYFNLYHSKDAIAMGLFGSGKKHPRTEGFLGDYIAIATDYFIFNTIDDGFRMKGQHAGLLKEEMLVPLIIATKKSL